MKSKFETTKEVVGFLAQLASLAAFGFAVYAFFVPETVSDYMERVAQVSENIDKNVTRIAESSEQTSDNTSELAKALPEWFELYGYAVGKSCPKDCQISFSLNNGSRFGFSGIVVKIFSQSGEVVSQKPLGLLTEYGGVEVNFSVDEPVSAVCVIARADEGGETFQETRDVLEYVMRDEDSGVIQLKYGQRSIAVVTERSRC
ncbi:hypothetical protein [Pseudophaeobacter sp.]|uniref:hypothetical protein n=1 Tax=Pseudophaeobacter sp. TaxID=1971739 RepID=UPI00329898AC